MNSLRQRILSFKIPYWVDSLWLTVLACYIMAGVPLVPLHGDEPTLIYMGRDFYYQFVERNPQLVSYRDWSEIDGEAGTQQQLRMLNGTVSKYLYGAAAYFSGYTINELNEQWEWGSGWDWNHQNGHVPSDDLLFRARGVSAAMLAIGVIVLFVIANNIGGRGTAYISTLLYTVNPALLLNGRRAMMEGSMILFSLLVVLAGLWVLQSRKLWAYVLLGLSSGLAVASKHTAAVTVAAVFLGCILVFAYEGLSKKRVTDTIYRVPTRQIVYLVITGILSLVVFYTLNPAWWSNPMARAAEVSQMRVDFMQAQRDTFGSYETIGDRLSGFWRQTFGMQITYAETHVDNFREHLVDEIAAYEASRLGGFISSSQVISIVFTVLTVIGVITLGFETATNANLRFLVGLWAAAMFALTLFLTPLEWQRYYLPAFPAVMLLTGLGIRYIYRLVQQRIN